MWIPTDHLPLRLSNLQAKAASAPLISSSSSLPPCAADGQDHEALRERLSAVLTYFSDKVSTSAEKRPALTVLPTLLLLFCFDLPSDSYPE